MRAFLQSDVIRQQLQRDGVEDGAEPACVFGQGEKLDEAGHLTRRRGRAERLQRKGYKAEIEAAVGACQRLRNIRLAGIKPVEIVFVEHVLDDAVGWPIPVERVAFEFDGAYCPRTNVGAAPSSGFRPKLQPDDELALLHPSIRLPLFRHADRAPALPPLSDLA